MQASSQVRFRALSVRPEGNGWVIGRVETGQFVSVPAVARRAIELLEEGHRVGEVAALLCRETGTRLAVGEFVAELDELGFLAAVDDEPRTDPVRPGPSLPWLRPAHVRWVLHPSLAWAAAAAALTVAGLLATHPALVPTYRVLVWSRYAGLVIVVNAAIAWAWVALHELGHLATARAAGVPARFTLGIRLQFLVAQTDVSGVWAAPRRIRMTVYMAGMTVNMCGALTCLLILVLAAPHGLAHRLLAVAMAEALLALPAQFMVFMRTDLYFVLQDLTGCANLYTDGIAYLRYRVRSRGGEQADPSLGYPSRQRSAVRWYSVVLVAGTAACLGIGSAVSVPALIALLAHAISEITQGNRLIRLDGLAALAVLAGFQLLWANRWWHRHGPQVRIYLSGRR
jgi:putative peptide zinc metalloprotease protein